MTITIFYLPHGIEKWDFGILETETSQDSLRMDMTNKFSHVLFLQMEDISSPLELTELLNSGMLKVNVNTQWKNIFIKTGFQKSDIFQLQARAMLPVNILLLLDGMDILKSGTTKLSTLKIHSKPMTLTSTHSLFHLEETTSLQEEKIWKLKFLISLMLKNHYQVMTQKVQSLLWLLIQDADGLQLEQNSDGKSGTLNQKTLQLLLMDNLNLRKSNKILKVNKPSKKPPNSTQWAH